MRYNLCNVQELKGRCGIGSRIYCFGAGRMFDTFFRIFPEYGFEENVCAVADNSDVKIGTFKYINSKAVPIVSVEQVLNQITAMDYILITMADYDSVIEQLDQYENLKETVCFISCHLMTAQYDMERLRIELPEQLSVYNEVRIPKTIHYCWFGKAKIPACYRRWIESWKEHCPDYEIIEWNEGNYDVHKNKYMGQAYDLGQWAFVSDYARLDIINEYGGVYLDTDVELIKNIDELLKNDAFCGFESSQYIAFGLGFGSVKYNHIIDEIKNYYDSQSFTLADGSMNRTACPIIQTEIMKKHGLKCDGEFQVVDGVTVYPSRVLCGMSPHSFRVERRPVYTYAIHHFAASWQPEGNWEKMKLDMRKWLKDENYIYPDL